MKPVIIFALQATTYSTVQALDDQSYRIVPVLRNPGNFYTDEAAAADVSP